MVAGIVLCPSGAVTDIFAGDGLEMATGTASATFAGEAATTGASTGAAASATTSVFAGVLASTFCFLIGDPLTSFF